MIGHSKRRAKQLGLLPAGQTSLKQSEEITRWAAWYGTLTVQADAEWTEPELEPVQDAPLRSIEPLPEYKLPQIVDAEFTDVPSPKPLAHFLQKILNFLESKQHAIPERTISD
jgi:hypothetical protein